MGCTGITALSTTVVLTGLRGAVSALDAGGPLPPARRRGTEGAIEETELWTLFETGQGTRSRVAKRACEAPVCKRSGKGSAVRRRIWVTSTPGAAGPAESPSH